MKEVDVQLAQGVGDDSDSYHALLMVTKTESEKSDCWCLDTGYHMTRSKGWFVSILIKGTIAR